MKTLLQNIATQQYNGEAESTLAFFQEQFQSQYEEGHLVLACHAAFPILLTPDLLYKIWLNFGEYQNVNNEPKIVKRIAISDILLSSLCKEVGREQYEMQADIRFVLLGYLQQYFGKERLDKLAHFLLQYVQTYHTNKDVLSKSFQESQEWTALAQLNPNLAAQKIAHSFAEKKGKATEQLRLNLVVERIVKQIENKNEESENGVSSGFRTLLKYGGGLKEYIFGEEEKAIHSFEVLAKFQSNEGIKIPVPKNVYRKLNLKKTKFEKSQIIFFSIGNNVIGEINLSENEIIEFKKLSRFLHSINYGTNNTEEIKDNYLQLKRLLNNQLKIKEIITNKINSSRRHIKLHIYSEDTELVNIPWELIPVNTVELFNHSQIFLIRNSFPISEENYCLPSPLPLKILVMISSPKDLDSRQLLNYETEERQLLEAFEPLFENGEVQIDFTNVGSLEALQEKLKNNYYHIFHFSGHSTYHEGTSYLQMEDHLTMNSKWVKAADFARILNMKPEHRPTLVLLNASKTAKGTTQGDLSGAHNHLLLQNIPTVIAMSGDIMYTTATQFAAEFYSQIAQKEPLHRAFKAAISHIRKQESEFLVKQLENNTPPTQWLYPKLYQSLNTIDLVDWKSRPQKLKLRSFRFISGRQQLLLNHNLSPQYHFVGRRKEIATALPLLIQGKAVLLRGQGGMGKTALAEHLVKRMIAYQNYTHPFVFDQTINMNTVLQSLTDFLFKEKKQFRIKNQLKQHKKGMEQFLFLLEKLTEYCLPVFVFDNLESLQSTPNEGFKDLHSDVAEIITLLYESEYAPMLLTCRYSVKECPNIKTVDLAHVELNDFWKKIRYLKLNHLAQHLQKQQANTQLLVSEKLDYKEVVRWLHHTFGGNFRALEWFDEQFQEQPKNILQSIQSLDALEKNYQNATQQVLAKMRQNLVFEQLLQLLDESEQQTLYLLAHFQTPIKINALRLQTQGISYKEVLKRLQSLTLVEKNKNFYFVNDLSKELLQQNLTLLQLNSQFSHLKAGNYYYSRYQNNEEYSTLKESLVRTQQIYHIEYHYDFFIQNIKQPQLIEIEAGLKHYIEAQYPERVNELGRIILTYYFKQSAFRKALSYAIPIEKVADEYLDTNVRNRIGLIYEVFGEYEKALQLYKYNLNIQQKTGDKRGEGTTLSNLSQIYHAKGDYDTALKYLQQSLDIQQQIGDKSGEGTTLNNISQIYNARGDYDTALKYLTQSLDIRQQIGDKSGEGSTLSNLSQIYQAKGDYDIAMEFLQQSLSIQQQIGDKRGEGTTLNNIGQIYNARGDYDTALKYLEQSLNIQQQIGDKSGEGKTLNNLSQISIARGDYDTALKYLEQSLNIQQQIGDKSGEGTTLSNLSQIYHAKGDYDTALKYLQQSLNIQQQIGNKSGEGKTLNNLSQISIARGDYDTALKYLQHSLNIQQQIGDKSGEGTTLSNLSQIYHAKGDYDTALKYLQQSFNIQQQIGDKSGEGTTLSNLSQIYHAKGDYDTALKYLQQSLNIQQQIGNVSGLATALTNIGSIYFELKQFDQAILPFIQAYQIYKQIGSSNIETVEQWLNALIGEIGEERFKNIMERNE